ncbi:hypothetical protein F0266_16405 [Vibrio coralliilyticus]|nr:hypothetical protein [Vibrio coralliilyticus]
MFANHAEKLILGYLDTRQLAIFTIAQLFPRIIKDNVKVILTPTANNWASKGFNYYKCMIIKHEIMLWLLGLVTYLLLYFTVEITIGIFFSKYEDSIIIAQLLSITIIYKFVESVKMSSMALSEHTPIFNKINNVSNLIKLILVSVLVPIYGTYGAVSTILIVDTIRFVYVAKEFNRI